jgi:hypothetical protein
VLQRFPKANNQSPHKPRQGILSRDEF